MSQLKSITPKLNITEEMTKVRHPLEYIAAPARAAEDPYAQMTENSLLLTNFPHGLKVDQSFIQDLCLKNGGIEGTIQSINIKQCMTGEASYKRNEVAYAIVDFQSKK